MNKIDEILAQLKKQEADAQKPQRVILWTLAVIGSISAVAGIAYAVYRFFAPEIIEDFDDDFDDEDFDDFFEDEEESVAE